MLNVRYFKASSEIVIEPMAGPNRPGMQAYQIGLIKQLWRSMSGNVECSLQAGGRRLVIKTQSKVSIAERLKAS